MSDAEAASVRGYLWKVGATVTAALIIQSFAAVWWASAISTRVQYMETRIASVERWVMPEPSGRKGSP